jgi:hypothetical protein
MISSVQEEAFWDLIGTLSEVGVLPHMMVIGSWAEYLYAVYYGDDYVPNIRTLDVDLLYRNIRLPRERVNIFEPLRKKGFVYTENTLSGIGKFFKDGALEIEILTRALGQGEHAIDIPAIGMKAPS